MIDYDEFCGYKPNIVIARDEANEGVLKEISATELKKMMTENVDFQLIDVREAYEYKASNLGGILIPLSILSEKTDMISKEKQVIVHCKSGGRSAKAIAQLEALGFTNIWNLTGGIEAFSID